MTSDDRVFVVAASITLVGGALQAWRDASAFGTLVVLLGSVALVGVALAIWVGGPITAGLVQLAGGAGIVLLGPAILMWNRSLKARAPRDGSGDVLGTGAGAPARTGGQGLSRAQYMEEVHRHVHDFFADHQAYRREFDQGPIQEVVPGFHVIEVAPGPRHRLTTYVSVGAGFPAEPGQSNLEFLMTAEQPSARHVELLAMTAHYHWSGERLGVGHTFAIGEPWIEGSTLDCMLVSRPYPYGPDLELLDAQDHHVHVLWLLPITQAERQFAKDNGLEAIETRFETAELCYWEPGRKSVV